MYQSTSCISDRVSLYTIAARAFIDTTRSIACGKPRSMQGVKTMFVGWIFLEILAFANCVSDEDFFPFGESAGDLKLPARKHAFGKVLMLNGTYSFYNAGHKQLQVNPFTDHLHE